jgi:N utilization substance protein B
LLYQQDLMNLTAEAALERAAAEEESLDPYSRHLFLGVQENKEALDREISRHLKGWTLERLAPLERNILRLGLYELRHVDDLPAAVALNEAVELAKRFASDEAAGLINGVLAAASAGGR